MQAARHHLGRSESPAKKQPPPPFSRSHSWSRHHHHPPPACLSCSYSHQRLPSTTHPCWLTHGGLPADAASLIMMLPSSLLCSSELSPVVPPHAVPPITPARPANCIHRTGRCTACIRRTARCTSCYIRRSVPPLLSSPEVPPGSDVLPIPSSDGGVHPSPLSSPLAPKKPSARLCMASSISAASTSSGRLTVPPAVPPVPPVPPEHRGCSASVSPLLS